MRIFEEQLMLALEIARKNCALANQKLCCSVSVKRVENNLKCVKDEVVQESIARYLVWQRLAGKKCGVRNIQNGTAALANANITAEK